MVCTGHIQGSRWLKCCWLRSSDAPKERPDPQAHTRGVSGSQHERYTTKSGIWPSSHVRLDIGGSNVITASITNEAVDALKLQKGQDAYAIIKATSVMIGVD